MTVLILLSAEVSRAQVLVQPTPNDRHYGPGRRGTGSRGYGEVVIVPSYGPFVHNVTFRDIVTYGDSSRKEERGNVIVKGIDETHDVSGISFQDVFYYGNRVELPR